MADEYVDAVNAGDVSRYGATLAEDIVFGAPDQVPLHGRAAVEKWFKESWVDTTTRRHLTITPNEVETMGGWAFAHGRFTVTVVWKTGKSQDIGGYFLNLFKRESDAAWRYKRSSFNFDKPFVPEQ